MKILKTITDDKLNYSKQLSIISYDNDIVRLMKQASHLISSSEIIKDANDDIVILVETEVSIIIYVSDDNYITDNYIRKILTNTSNSYSTELREYKKVQEIYYDIEKAKALDYMIY